MFWWCSWLLNRLYSLHNLGLLGCSFLSMAPSFLSVAPPSFIGSFFSIAPSSLPSLDGWLLSQLHLPLLSTFPWVLPLGRAFLHHPSLSRTFLLHHHLDRTFLPTNNRLTSPQRRSTYRIAGLNDREHGKSMGWMDKGEENTVSVLLGWIGHSWVYSAYG